MKKKAISSQAIISAVITLGILVLLWAVVLIFIIQHSLPSNCIVTEAGGTICSIAFQNQNNYSPVYNLFVIGTILLISGIVIAANQTKKTRVRLKTKTKH